MRFFYAAALLCTSILVHAADSRNPENLQIEEAVKGYFDSVGLQFVDV